MPFDLDGAVKGQFDDLIGRMRAKRLQKELPQAPHMDAKLNDEAEKAGHADEEQEALESMLNDDGGGEASQDEVIDRLTKRA